MKTPFGIRRLTASARLSLYLVAGLTLLFSNSSISNAAPAGVGQMFRLDGGDTTYVFGVKERGEFQSLY